MLPLTGLFISAIRKSSKLLHRDFCELELLQQSKRGTTAFCEKAYARTAELLTEELKKYADCLIFDASSMNRLSNSDTAILINPIDSIQNLSKSLPFFAMSITYLKKIEGVWGPEVAIINAPALDEMVYAEKGKGAWIGRGSSVNSLRLRVSECANLDQAVMTTDSKEAQLWQNHNMRYFGSKCYDVMLLASGKLDVIHYLSSSPVLQDGFGLIIKEAGGMILEAGNGFIASNHFLAEKFQQLVSKKSL